MRILCFKPRMYFNVIDLIYCELIMWIGEICVGWEVFELSTTYENIVRHARRV